MSAWPLCGNCSECLPLTNRLLEPAPQRSLLPGAPPTAAGLERHAKKFGPAQVAETAAEYGLSIAIERPKAERRVGGPSLKTRVAALVADGHSAEVIAEMENLSPSKARRLMAELGA